MGKMLCTSSQGMQPVVVVAMPMKQRSWLVRTRRRTNDAPPRTRQFQPLMARRKPTSSRTWRTRCVTHPDRMHSSRIREVALRDNAPYRAVRTAPAQDPRLAAQKAHRRRPFSRPSPSSARPPSRAEGTRVQSGTGAATFIGHTTGTIPNAAAFHRAASSPTGSSSMDVAADCNTVSLAS
jgi:hypothetical protein